MSAEPQFDAAFIKQNMEKGEFGLEKESLRIDEEGYLSHTKHPFGDRSDITRDFCENQIELITGVSDSAQEMLRQMFRLQTEVVLALQKLPTGKEYLWPFSNPPYVRGEEDIAVAQFDGGQERKTEYRNYLAGKYGKRKMLFSGIHLNYSFAEEMLRAEYQLLLSDTHPKAYNTPVRHGDPADTGRLPNEPVYQAYKDHVYLQLAQKLTEYSWLIVYLTASSPVLDPSFLHCGSENGEERSGIYRRRGTHSASGNGSGEREDSRKSQCGKQGEFRIAEKWTENDLVKYASVRCGELGYWNDFTPVFDYQDLDSYIGSIETYIRSGRLRGVSELYYPLRLKPRGENSLELLREKGVNHIELRMLDVNPLSPVGLFQEDVEFLHYFMVYLHYQQEVQLTEEEQKTAVRNEKQAALFDDSQALIQDSDGGKVPVRQAALEVLQKMELFFSDMGAEAALDRIRYQKDKLTIPDNRYADRVRRKYGTDYVKRGVSLAEDYADLARRCTVSYLSRECI